MSQGDGCRCWGGRENARHVRQRDGHAMMIDVHFETTFLCFIQYESTMLARIGQPYIPDQTTQREAALRWNHKRVINPEKYAVKEARESSAGANRPRQTQRIHGVDGGQIIRTKETSSARGNMQDDQVGMLQQRILHYFGVDFLVIMIWIRNFMLSLRPGSVFLGVRVGGLILAIDDSGCWWEDWCLMLGSECLWRASGYESEATAIIGGLDWEKYGCGTSGEGILRVDACILSSSFNQLAKQANLFAEIIFILDTSFGHGEDVLRDVHWLSRVSDSYQQPSNQGTYYRPLNAHKCVGEKNMVDNILNAPTSRRVPGTRESEATNSEIGGLEKYNGGRDASWWGGRRRIGIFVLLLLLGEYYTGSSLNMRSNVYKHMQERDIPSYNSMLFRSSEARLVEADIHMLLDVVLSKIEGCACSTSGEGILRVDACILSSSFNQLAKQANLFAEIIFILDTSFGHGEDVLRDVHWLSRVSDSYQQPSNQGTYYRPLNAHKCVGEKNMVDNILNAPTSRRVPGTRESEATNSEIGGLEKYNGGRDASWWGGRRRIGIFVLLLLLGEYYTGSSLNMRSNVYKHMQERDIPSYNSMLFRSSEARLVEADIHMLLDVVLSKIEGVRGVTTFSMLAHALQTIYNYHPTGH
ncbi:hypothetical protein PILCRDRAFT_86104 [Piloderma croceum F 1598]|uniref:Uncharacterized protein n=1 Tax=Piloderma croceum (strain F 1598) TaxID=765440 RepID=A0A0C3CB55_PILCF|nr:hypothetical protein PILCRDRAFT_86104 [Piloderma croceum F 1598]